MHRINYGLIQLVANEILGPYKAEELDALERCAPGQLYIEASEVAFRRLAVDHVVSL